MPRGEPPEADPGDPARPPDSLSADASSAISEEAAPGAPADSSFSPAAASVVEPKPLPTTPPDLAPLWSKVIRAEGISPLLRAVLINSSLTSFNAGKATIACLPRYATDANKRWRAPIAELIAKESASATPVEVIIHSPEGALAPVQPPAASSAHSPTPSAAQPFPAAPAAPATTGQVDATTHPLVKQALELFGGRIVDIQPRKRS